MNTTEWRRNIKARGGEIELLLQDFEKVEKELKELVRAATHLLHACERADEDGELALTIDGALLDDVREALEADAALKEAM